METIELKVAGMTLPFFLMMIVAVALIVLFPQLCEKLHELVRNVFFELALENFPQVLVDLFVPIVLVVVRHFSSRPIVS